MNNLKTKVSLGLNLLVFALTVFAFVAMFTGFQFMGKNEAFTALGLSAFKFFTVDSNILAALTALVLVFFEADILRGKKTSIPKWLHLLSLAATTGVTLTMMVTVFFLAPTVTYNPLYLFANANLFMHLVTPLLCIVQFVFFERETKISFKESLWGVCPMVLYALFYVPNVFLHQVNGRALPEYDWYGFFFAGLNTGWIVLPLIMLITWGFSLLLWFGNKKLAK